MGAKALVKHRPMIEVVFWSLLFMGEFIPDVMRGDPVHIAGIRSISYLLPLFGAVRLWYYAYTRLKQHPRVWLILGVSSVALILAAPAINYLLFNAMFPAYRYGNSLWIHVLMCSPISGTIIGGVNLILYTLDAWFKDVTAQANLKNEKLLSELRALKSQINPHFLFNTLNNIYSYACLQHPSTPVMIEKLSQILRYLVYEGEKERVELKQEMTVLENLIDLYKIKNSEQKNIHLHQSGILAHHQIAPLLLINLLENAFKHSDALSNPEGFIHVKAEVENEQLQFHISNSMKQQMVESGPNGVGQPNIEKQIELIYADQYSLHTEVGQNVYHLDLCLPIDNALEHALSNPHR